MIEKIFYNEVSSVPFEWVAEYADGTLFKEYQDRKENNFKDIVKENVAEFYFAGNGIRYGFDTGDGAFFVDKEGEGKTNRITSILTINDEHIKINGINGEYKDIIQYKGFHIDFTPILGANNNLVKLDPNKTMIDSFHIGWKKAFKRDEGTIYTKLITYIDHSGLHLETKINPTYELNALYTVYDNGKEIESKEIIKLTGQATQIITTNIEI